MRNSAIRPQSMRNALLVALGLVLGVLASFNIINALQRRDAYPRGVMNVMQHNVAALRDDLHRQRCGDAGRDHWLTLRALSGQIGTAVYNGDTPEPPFREFEQRLADAVAATPAECSQLAPALDRIKAACDDCHRQYR